MDSDKTSNVAYGDIFTIFLRKELLVKLMKQFLEYIYFFLLGLIFLNMFSIIQKIYIIQSLELISNPTAYIVPSIFGGLTGLIIGDRAMKVHDLNKQLQTRVQNLERILPICSICKKVCNNPEAEEAQRIWIPVEDHLSPQKMSHGYCPDCFKEEMKNLD